MFIDSEKFYKNFNDFENNLKVYSLPKWEELPDLELYMDQVISLLTKYLGIYYETIGNEKIITPSMINNYVKLSVIPAPIKKKYTRTHLAYLLVLCTLKKSFDIATIQKIMPVDLSENDIINTYNSFVHNQHKAFIYVTEQLMAVANPIIKENKQERMNDLLMQVASSANLFKILTEKITNE